MKLPLSESDALREFLAVETPLQRALKAFISSQKERYQRDCAGYMGRVPRDTERACDSAAKADAYNGFWEEMRYFLESSK